MPATPGRRLWVGERARAELLQAELDARATYQVRTHTAPDKGAATSARVHIEAWGAGEGGGGAPSTGEVRLMGAEGGDGRPPFERGASDTFRVGGGGQGGGGGGEGKGEGGLLHWGRGRQRWGVV